MAEDSSWKPGDDPEEPVGMEFPSSPRYARASSGWSPAIDIYENAFSVVVMAELPGVDRDDIRICFSNNELTISGVKRKESGVKGCSFFRVERFYGAFRRSFKIISPVNKEKIDATFDAGILTVIMPKIKSAEGDDNND